MSTASQVSKAILYFEISPSVDPIADQATDETQHARGTAT
jgi:hypothetical protein